MPNFASDDEQLSSIREQLDNMNNATDDINTYEIKLETAKKQFGETQALFHAEMVGVQKKLAKHVTKARPYFDLESRRPEFRRLAQKAAQQFERKKTILEMAKDTLNVLHSSLNANTETDAESKYKDVIKQQLNIVAEAEQECTEAEKLHCFQIKELLQLESTLNSIAENYGSSIKKARPYYERKEHFTKLLKCQLERISLLENEVRERKDSYSTSMRNLEKISEQIHIERSMNMDNISDIFLETSSEDDL